MIQAAGLFWPLLLALETLTLREAERRAQAAHPAVVVGEQTAAAADARADESRAALMPQLSLTASYRYATANRTIRVGTPAFAIPSLTSGSRAPSTTLYDSINAGATASQVIADFGQARAAWRSAQQLAEGARFDAAGARGTILLDVRLAFFAARARRELVEVGREDLANQRQHLVQVQALVDVKARPLIDLVQARATLGAAELRAIAAENDYGLARTELARAMGATAGDDFEIASDDLPPVDRENASPDGLLADARQTRPEARGGEQRERAQENAVAAARAALAPTLRLTLSATDVGPMLDPGPFDRRALRWNYGAALVMSWPIFEGGRGLARIAEARANLAVARAQRRQVEIDLAVEVERARRGVAAAKAASAVAETTTENARERLRLAEGRYQAGVGTALEVSDAQLGYISAAAQRVQTRYDLASARAQLLHALGRTR